MDPVPAVPRRRYSTGDSALDERVAELLAEAEIELGAELVQEIVVSALLLGRDKASRLDLKIINSAIKEMRYAFKVFAPYRHVKKVSVFGSARTRPGDPDYEQARRFGEAIAAQGWMVVTGAGPGSMAAANHGAGTAASFGVNIRLPFEAAPNPFVAEDPKLINFKYFFTRKLMFIKEAEAFVLVPGGFGTMDEAFELLTLIQTGKSDLHPIVFLDAPGSTYWKGWMRFVDEELLGGGYIAPIDRSLFLVTDDVGRAVDEVVGFYRNFHSMRFVGNRLVLRMRRTPDDEGLEALVRDFADIIVSGGIDRVGPSRAEVQDDDALDADRIAFLFDRMQYGRLRQLVNRLNELEEAPPPTPTR